MIVCLCKGVSDRKIEKAVREGATTVAAVGRECEAGTGCGMCHDAICDILQRNKVLAQSDSRVIDQAQFATRKTVI